MNLRKFCNILPGVDIKVPLPRFAREPSIGARIIKAALGFSVRLDGKSREAVSS